MSSERSWAVRGWVVFALACVLLPVSYLTCSPQYREWAAEDARDALKAAGFQVRYEPDDGNDGIKHTYPGVYVSRGASEQEWAEAKRRRPHESEGPVAVIVVMGAPRRMVVKADNGAPYVCGEGRLVADILRALR